MPDKTPRKSASESAPKFRCPICGKPATDEQFIPFCSQRCRTIDLGRWVDEKYIITRPIEQSDLDEE